MINLPKKCYQNTILIFICLLVFFPVGLLLVWKKAEWKKSAKVFLTCTVAIVIFGCFLFISPKSPESITLSDKPFTMDVNQTKTVAFVIRPHMNEKNINFYSSNDSVVRFTDCVLTAVDEGKATIYAVSKDGKVKSNTVTVTVVDKTLMESQKRADPVVRKIAAISNADDRGAIKQAREAYEALPSAAKPLVTNIGVLMALENGITSEQTENAKSSVKTKTNSSANGATSASAMEKSNTSDPEHVMVYIGKSGNKYHKKTCPTLKGNGRAVTLAEALKEGRTPCSICKP